MQKVSVWSIAIPLILLSIGFILVGTLGYAMSPEWLTAAQIREEARRAIPQPTYPPPPAGKPVVHQNVRQECTQVPDFHGFKIGMQSVCTNVPVQAVSVEGPSTDETKDWQTKVSAMRANYETAVDQEASRISERQRSDLKSFVKDMIQICTGILGLVAGLAALIVGVIRGNVPKGIEQKEAKDEST